MTNHLERGIFDIRLHIEANTTSDVWALAYHALRILREADIPGIDARYTTLRPPSRSKTFRATMRNQRDHAPLQSDETEATT